MAEFKVGDTVRIKNGANVGVSTHNWGDIGQIVAVDDYGSNLPYEVNVEGNDTMWYSNAEIEKVSGNRISNKPRAIMRKLTTVAIKFLDKDVKAFVKAGFMSSDLELTPEGEKFVVTQLFLENKEELGKAARKHLKDEKKEQDEE